MTCFAYSVYAINSKVFFSRLLFLRGILDLDKNIFLWQTCSCVGSSEIRVVLHQANKAEEAKSGQQYN